MCCYGVGMFCFVLLCLMVCFVLGGLGGELNRVWFVFGVLLFVCVCDGLRVCVFLGCVVVLCVVVCLFWGVVLFCCVLCCFGFVLSCLVLR